MKTPHVHAALIHCATSTAKGTSMNKELLIKEIIDDWNSLADEYNQWHSLGVDEKLECVASAVLVQPVQPAGQLCEDIVDAGVMALLQCSESDLESYSPKLMDRYENDVIRVYAAMTAKLEKPKEWTTDDMSYRPGGYAVMRPDYCPAGGEPCQNLCATPCSTLTKRTWVGLTHEERFDLLAAFEEHKHEWHANAILIDMVEAKLKEKNND